RPDISVTVSGQTAGGLAALVGWLLDRDLPFNLNFYRENDCSAGYDELQLDERRIVSGMLAAFREIEERLPERSLLGALVDRANLATAHNKTCGVGESYLVIDQNGGVAKCQMEIERPITSVHAPDPLGIIRADTIGVHNLPVQEKAGCRDCAWQLWCAGGCAVATFRATGRYDVQSPNCGIYQALYPAALRLEGLRVLKYGAREYYG
ncbi:MAG TPA: SPASM domain-containing protein, partial [Roseiflexaceae bacterium]|nr:SPASM domain-containing protein [Roseiflexaceae bacterium]